MIVYREESRPLLTLDAIASIRCKCGTLATGNNDHELSRDLLIEFGQWECGIADALSPSCDLSDSRLAELRKFSVALGQVFARSWRGQPRSDRLIRRLTAMLDGILSFSFPDAVRVTELEGYAYYGLFPEVFVAAAERFFREARPHHSVCIGIRSIGTSLSAAVAGAIAESGGSVESLTVRPRGHPFDRQLQVSDAIRSRWRENRHFHYAIVDEGPGLSGSSFGSVAEALSDAGIPDSRIVFFPSWNPDSASFVSRSAAERWNHHRSVVGEFEEELVHSGWMQRAFGRGHWRDVSAGKWREVLYTEPSEFPAVQPQHERRKFIRLDHPQLIAKFVGFGARGQACAERARILSGAGFTTNPHELTNGFLLSSFVTGNPAVSGTRSRELVCRMAHYLAHVRSELPASAPVPWDELLRMVLYNIGETLGQDWAARAERIVLLRHVVEDGATYRLDGRMLPHEWIQTATGFLKTDVLDHHHDHFFPGPQDVAWDVAGTAIEFAFDNAETEGFVDLYAGLAGDMEIRHRLPFYRVAYTAFRLAYSRLAENSLSGPDGDRFGCLALRYSAALKREISRMK